MGGVVAVAAAVFVAGAVSVVVGLRAFGRRLTAEVGLIGDFAAHRRVVVERDREHATRERGDLAGRFAAGRGRRGGRARRGQRRAEADNSRVVGAAQVRTRVV